jgi:deoxyribodipyrimidine photo-lyase
MDRGLWRYTRHPNYFGDACMWWGIFGISYGSAGQLVTVVSPLLMTFILTRGTGVADPALTVPPNRARFLAQSVASLRKQLRKRGGDLVIRRGAPVAEIMRIADSTRAQAVYIADGVSRYAARRRARLEAECATHRLRLTVTPGHAVVPAGELRPAGGGHYRVFTPYWRAWRAAAWRRAYPAPRVIAVPAIG